VQVEVQLAVDSATLKFVPSAEVIQQWASAAVQQAEVASSESQAEKQMTVRIVDVDEVTQLNTQYRQKTGATNVLSFPFEWPAEVPEEARDANLGDLVVCAEVVEQEAEAQQKSLEAHWAHMIVHGTFHLLGYDHLTDDDAQQMEAKEISVLNDFGYANPYE
jgi:probable rRNA maturation factor